MKLSYYLLIPVVALLLGSCRESKKMTNSLQGLEIKIPASKMKAEEFTDLFGKVNYVPLETIKESLITRVDKLIVGDSIIVVWDKENSSVLLFNRDGKFISKLGEQGKGPNEYVDIYDITVDDESKHIVLNDPGKQALIYFDFAGNFLEYRALKKPELTGPALIAFKDYIIFNRGYYPMDGNYLGVFDKKTLDFKESLLPFKITTLQGGGDHLFSFHKQDSTLLFLAPLSNEVFQIDSNLVTTKLYDLVFDVGNPDYNEINERKFNSITEFSSYIQSAGYIINARKFLVHGDYIYFSFLNKSGLLSIFYNKGTGKVRVTNGVKGDLDRHVWTEILTSKGEELVGVIDNSEHIFKLKTIYNIPQEELGSNPVLAFYSMNDSSFE